MRAAALALAAVLLGAGVAACDREPPPLPELYQAPSFTLVDQSGAPFGSEKLAGTAWVATFVFTRCPVVCPKTVELLASVDERTRGLGDRVRFVSFSVDPEHDTPAVLGAYAKARALSRWTLLTGPYDDVRRAVEGGLKIHMDRPSDPADLMSLAHGSHFLLVDGAGKVRGTYDPSTPGRIDELVRDLHTLLR